MAILATSAHPSVFRSFVRPRRRTASPHPRDRQPVTKAPTLSYSPPSTLQDALAIRGSSTLAYSGEDGGAGLGLGGGGGNTDASRPLPRGVTSCKRGHAQHTHTSRASGRPTCQPAWHCDRHLGRSVAMVAAMATADCLLRYKNQSTGKYSSDSTTHAHVTYIVSQRYRHRSTCNPLIQRDFDSNADNTEATRGLVVPREG